MTTHIRGRRLPVPVRHVSGLDREKIGRYAHITHTTDLKATGAFDAAVFVGDSRRQVDGFNAGNIGELIATLYERYQFGNPSNHVVYVAPRNGGIDK